MDDAARMQPSDRRDLFNEASAQRGDINPDVIEKDFWVCWTLKHIFALDPPPAELIFKGGTSLSKVYGAIERFSEDIDLSLSRDDLGFVGERDPYKVKLRSKKKAGALVDDIVERCRQVIETELLPRFRARVESVLGPGDTPAPWSLSPAENDPQTIDFTYPAGVESGGESALNPYVCRVVRLELGARSDDWPAEEHLVRPYAAEVLPEQFKVPECRVRALSAERTFWEKVTLLHAEAHRPPDKPSRDRTSRHYYDVARLYQSRIGARALSNHKLLEQVVAHKSLFFRSGWANYKTAAPGTFRLVPPTDRHPLLKTDYRIMRENMIFGESYSFDELMAVIAEVERAVNTLSPPG
jgi:Nucleotidyl transferase AbiEii toxin, Type IV TA system